MAMRAALRISRSVPLRCTTHALRARLCSGKSGVPEGFPNSGAEFEAMLKKRIANFPGLAEDLQEMQESFAKSRVGEGVQEATQHVSDTLLSIPEETKKKVEEQLGHEVMSPLQLMSELNDLKQSSAEMQSALRQALASNAEFKSTIGQLQAKIDTLEQTVSRIDKK